MAACVAFVGFWDSRPTAVRVVPAADGAVFGGVVAFTLSEAAPVAAPRVGVDPADAAFALFVVPAAGATAPLVLPEGPLVAGGVSGA